MFGQQNDQNDHSHHDNQPMGDVLNGQAVDTMMSDSFNPALPASPADQPGAPTNDNQGYDASTDNFAPTTAPVATPSPAPVASDDLIGIKQQALTQLSPLVGHLDQSPEEKFRTTMMMIQASDRQDLIKEAYETAQQITDEKAKAQALLDIVNEINYFTMQQHGE